MTDLCDLITWHTHRAAVSARMDTIAWYTSKPQDADSGPVVAVAGVLVVT